MGEMDAKFDEGRVSTITVTFSSGPILSLAPSDIERIREMLFEADREFVPPLSGRNSPRDRRLHDTRQPDGKPWDYWNAMKAQPAVVAHITGEIVGFLAYIPNHSIVDLDVTVDAYVTTVVVAPHARRRGIAEAMYRELMALLNAPDRAAKIATRTWSTNSSHLAILEGLGFRLAGTIENGRRLGVSTVYYQKP